MMALLRKRDNFRGENKKGDKMFDNKYKYMNISNEELPFLNTFSKTRNK